MTTGTFLFGIAAPMRSDLRESGSSEPFFYESKTLGSLTAQYERNLQLYDFLVQAVSDGIENPRLFCRVSVVLEMHKIAFEGLSPHAGLLRISDVFISGSAHSAPKPVAVPGLLEDMIEYLRANWDRSSGIHLSAFALWRLLWIHPFLDGNGVVARAFSYGVLCIKAGGMIPGTPTLPEQIVVDRKRYYDALGAADESWKRGKLDLSMLEDFIHGAVREQTAGTR